MASHRRKTRIPKRVTNLRMVSQAKSRTAKIPRVRSQTIRKNPTISRPLIPTRRMVNRARGKRGVKRSQATISLIRVASPKMVNPKKVVTVAKVRGLNLVRKTPTASHRTKKGAHPNPGSLATALMVRVEPAPMGMGLQHREVTRLTWDQEMKRILNTIARQRNSFSRS